MFSRPGLAAAAQGWRTVGTLKVVWPPVRFVFLLICSPLLILWTAAGVIALLFFTGIPSSLLERAETGGL